MFWTTYTKDEAADSVIDMAIEELASTDPTSPLMGKLRAYKDEFFSIDMPDGSVRLPLTQGKHAFIDGVDYPAVSRHKWYAAFDGQRWYARAKIAGKSVPLHKFLTGVIPKGMVVDHKDRDGLNNRRGNLRVATHGNNMCNRKGWHRKTNNGLPKSKHKGVYYMSSARKKNLTRPWAVKIKYDGKLHHIGYYGTEDEAAVAYNSRVIELHGRFAVLNTIPEGIDAEGTINAA